MKILIVRTDNIGDLVCTTPMISALRRALPDAWIGLLANAYSADAVSGNDDLDEVFVYRKAKHLEPGEWTLLSYCERLRTILGLWRRRIDLVLIPAVAGQASALRFARWIGARCVVANVDSPCRHEVEKVFEMLGMLPGMTLRPSSIPGCRVVADPKDVLQLQRRIGWHQKNPEATIVGLHISARKPSQRWPVERFVEFAHTLAERRSVKFLLFWSPGKEDDPRHPGDDDKARKILAGCADLEMLAIPTDTLPSLIAGLSLCDVLVQSDGGAMHLAAGLGKPILCFFGQSDTERWRPWGVPHELLQPEGRNVANLSVEAALDAYERLMAKIVNES